MPVIKLFGHTKHILSECVWKRYTQNSDDRYLHRMLDDNYYLLLYNIYFISKQRRKKIIDLKINTKRKISK